MPDENKWNPKQGRPTQRAFKQADLSVWDVDRLESKGSHLEDLQEVSFIGWGQALHLVDDYFRLAKGRGGTGTRTIQNSCRMEA